MLVGVSQRHALKCFNSRWIQGLIPPFPFREETRLGLSASADTVLRRARLMAPWDTSHKGISVKRQPEGGLKAIREATATYSQPPAILGGRFLRVASQLSGSSSGTDGRTALGWLEDRRRREFSGS